MKVAILLVFVLSIQLVLGADTCSLTCGYAHKTKALLANCVGYKFQVTPSRGNFDNARQQCFDMGGDLIHINLGPEGRQYHETIRQLAAKYTEQGTFRGMWIGYTDRATEGRWRLLNGKSFDAHDQSQDALAYWGTGQPSNYNGVQDCGHICRFSGSLEYDDDACSSIKYGLCEIKVNKCLNFK